MIGRESIIRLLNNHIQKKVEKSEMFCASDILLQAKKEVGSFIARYKNIEEFIFEIFKLGLMSLYCLSPVYIDRGKEKKICLIYHERGTDPFDYEPADPTVLVEEIKIVESIKTEVKKMDQTIYSVSRDNRLNIPTELLRKIGIEKRQMVYISKNCDFLEISVFPIRNIHSEMLAVNEEGRLRIPLRIRDLFGVIGKEFRIGVIKEENKILLEQVV